MQIMVFRTRCITHRKSLGDSPTIWKSLANSLRISVSASWKEEIRADTVANMVARLRPILDACVLFPFVKVNSFNSARTGTWLKEDQKDSVMRRIHLINNEMTRKWKFSIDDVISEKQS